MNSSFQRKLPQLATAVVLTIIVATASHLYDGFFSLRVLANLLTDNAALGIASIGMTLVIFCGGIDLSVGAVAGFSSILTATLVEQHGYHPLAAALVALSAGTTLGLLTGAVIPFFRQPPFLITLAGLFLMRGCAFWITTEAIGVSHPYYLKLANIELPIGDAFGLPLAALILLAVFLLGGLLGHYTRFGRNLIAIGGSEQSALLMGVPLGSTRIAVYAFSGFCAALSGLVLVLYTGSGNPSFGIGLELDAIAVVVIGGTLLIGGRGHIWGTVLGLLVFGTIQSALIFDGRLSAQWSRIVVGVLLLAFVLLQRVLIRRFSRG
jgi:simple sugar transport system permease protein